MSLFALKKIRTIQNDFWGNPLADFGGDFRGNFGGDFVSDF